MHSEGCDLSDMLVSWVKDALYRIAAGADLRQAVRVAAVMDHAPAAYRDFYKVVLLANCEAASGEESFSGKLCAEPGRGATFKVQGLVFSPLFSFISWHFLYLFSKKK